MALVQLHEPAFVIVLQSVLGLSGGWASTMRSQI